MSSSSDRYAWAVVRNLPEAQRPEIEREVHELIGEMSDARRSTSPELDPATVEQAVLTELGDPNRLAARYVERPRALISAEVFPEYIRVLKLVLIIAVPIVTAIAVIGAAFGEDPDAVVVIGAAFGGVFGAGVQVAFWVTLVYAFADKWKAGSPWTTDDLPDVPAAHVRKGFGVGDTVFGIVVTVLAGVALVWQHVRPVLEDDNGDGVPFLHPDIWNGAGQALLALLTASLIVQIIVLIRSRWTYPLAGANLAVNVASLAIVAWLAFDERLVNTRFLEVLADRADWDKTPSFNPWIAIAIIGIIEVWDSVEAFVNARRGAANRS